jgi:cytochrome c oxidase subunit 2
MMAIMSSLTSFVNLAADYGWGPYTILWIFIAVVTISTAVFLIVMASSRSKKKMTFAAKRKYHIEMYWCIAVAGILIWLWVISYPWMPPVAFSEASVSNTASAAAQGKIQTVNITAGQWFWIMDLTNNNKPVKAGGESPYVVVEAGKPVKFIAHSLDVNHGFGVFANSTDSQILLQMQVVPGVDNVFYYTFKEPGNYMVRCLEYCGYAHPYMTSVIKVIPENQEGGKV